MFVVFRTVHKVSLQIPIIHVYKIKDVVKIHAFMQHRSKLIEPVFYVKNIDVPSSLGRIWLFELLFNPFGLEYFGGPIQILVFIHQLLRKIT